MHTNPPCLFVPSIYSLSSSAGDPANVTPTNDNTQEGQGASGFSPWKQWKWCWIPGWSEFYNGHHRRSWTSVHDHGHRTWTDNSNSVPSNKSVEFGCCLYFSPLCALIHLVYLFRPSIHCYLSSFIYLVTMHPFFYYYQLNNPCILIFSVHAIIKTCSW